MVERSGSDSEIYLSGQELVALPKELRIEKRLRGAARSGLLTWLPVALLAPLALAVEAVPAAIGILLILGFTTRELRRSRTDLLPYLELADRGELADAIVKIAEMAKREHNWQRKAFLVGVLSNLELRAGNRDTAEALAREAARHRDRQHPVLERSLRANLAAVLVLTGQREEALATLPEGPLPDPLTDSSRLIVWTRDGRYEEVASYKHQRLPQMQGLRHNNRVMALLKAFAMSKSGGGALKLQRYLDEARPRLRNEFDYLTEEWPELRAFVEQHPELSSRRSMLERL